MSSPHLNEIPPQKRDLTGTPYTTQKSHECAFKLTDLWITGLLFDSNYKFVSLLPLAIPIYYKIWEHTSHSVNATVNSEKKKVSKEATC